MTGWPLRHIEPKGGLLDKPWQGRFALMQNVCDTCSSLERVVKQPDAGSLLVLGHQVLASVAIGASSNYTPIVHHEEVKALAS